MRIGQKRSPSFLRQADGTWSFQAATGLDAVARIRCLSIGLPLAGLYAGVEFAAGPNPPPA